MTLTKIRGTFKNNNMEFIYRIRKKIDEFFTTHMRMDGAQHLLAAIIIYDILKYIIPDITAVFVTLIILILKEVVFDLLIKKVQPEYRDLFWGIVGLILSFI